MEDFSFSYLRMSTIEEIDDYIKKVDTKIEEVENQIKELENDLGNNYKLDLLNQNVYFNFF